MKSIKNILVALPTVARNMKSGTAISFAQTAMALQRQGIAVDFQNIDSAEIVTARDLFANALLHSAKWDALLFIDSDMAFDPRLIVRMLKQHRGVTGVAYPRRGLDLVKLIVAGQAKGDFDKSMSQASEFVVRFDWEEKAKTKIEIRDGFCSAAAIGMGIALISRGALEAMVAEKIVSPRLDLNVGANKPCWSFFGILEADQVRLSEDYSFCYRWTKLMGRDLRVCVDERISHIGDFEYRGRYSDLLS